MSPIEFKEKVSSYYCLVIDGHLSKDDAEDAILDTLTAVNESDQDIARDYHRQVWAEYFGE